MGMPLVLVVIFPLVYFVTISLLPATETASPPEVILSLLPPETAEHGYRQFWMDAFTTLLCPLLYLCVPVVCAVASASCAFLGEKENGTLETLFLSSMNAKSIFSAKITACSLISVLISLVSFVVFAITMTVADIMISAPYFFRLEWLALVVLLMPVLAFFSVTFISLIMPRVFSVGEALQTMGYLLLPFVVLYLLQIVGVIHINALLLIGLAVLLAVVSIILFNCSARRFQPERLTGAKHVDS